MIPVKICGITKLQDALTAGEYGAAAVGFIFHEKSPRVVVEDEVGKWISSIPNQMKKIGVFVDNDVDNINSIGEKLSLDMIQLHGNESPEFCNEISLPVIKVIRVSDTFNQKILEDYSVDAFLFDTYQKGNPGGTGECFNWNLVTELETDIPIILSGGLKTENVKTGIEIVQPAAVDVSSGVEISPGIKDELKIQNFIMETRQFPIPKNYLWKAEGVKI